MKTTTLAAALLLGLAVACSSGPGPDADRGRSAAEIQATAAELETPALESTVEAYRATIEDLDGQREALQDAVGDFVAKLGEKGLDAFTGDKDAAAELDADRKELQEQLEELGADLDGLRRNLDIYVAELQQRSDG